MPSRARIEREEELQRIRPIRRQQDVAYMLGLSRSHVGQIETEALRKLWILLANDPIISAALRGSRLVVGGQADDWYDGKTRVAANRSV